MACIVRIAWNDGSVAVGFAGDDHNVTAVGNVQLKFVNFALVEKIHCRFDHRKGERDDPPVAS